MARVEHGANTGDTGATGYWGISPLPIEPPAWQRRIFVERPRDLAALAAELEGARVLAIDAEFVQPRVRAHDEPTHRLAVLQLAFDNAYRASYVVDALRLADLSPLRAALESPAILKLFHGISADARVLATRDLYPRHLLDLEAVSRSIFGQRESGLQAMLRRACSIRMDKSYQRADWSRRPLTPAMIAYAARDAEMTYVLYGWLKTHYPWAVGAHEQPAGATLAGIAEWLAPALESARMRSVELALIEAGLGRDTATQERDLAHALATVTMPGQRARLMRIISDLELRDLATQVRPYLAAPLAEERASAARALGRLRDWQSQTALEALLHDPVADVRQAAQTALEAMKKAPAPSPRRGWHASSAPRPSSNRDPHVGPTLGPRTWIVQGETNEAEEAEGADDWRATLRRRFGAHGGEERAADGRDVDGRDVDGRDVDGGASAADSRLSAPSAPSEPPEETGEE